MRDAFHFCCVIRPIGIPIEPQSEFNLHMMINYKQPIYNIYTV